MDIEDQTLYVWIARVNNGGTAVTVWSARDKARQWCEHKINADITWDDDDDRDDRIAGHANGDIKATVQRAEVQDPVSLANRYTRHLPNARDIPTDESFYRSFSRTNPLLKAGRGAITQPIKPPTNHHPDLDPHSTGTYTSLLDSPVCMYD
jgi:hypothetical protein